MKFTNRKDGFTMLELLAVLAIVLILGAILFPAIESAREKSLTTACSQNVKQLVLAITQYEQDKGEFPPGRQFVNASSTAGAATDMYKWTNKIAPYMHADPSAVSGMGNVSSTAAAPALAGLPLGDSDRFYPEAYRCPSVSSWDKVGYNASYGYNWQYLGNADPKTVITGAAANRGSVNFPVRKSSIVRPDQMICVADSDGTGFNSYLSAAATSGTTDGTPNNLNLGAYGYLLDPTWAKAVVMATGGTFVATLVEATAGGTPTATLSPAAGGIVVDNNGNIVVHSTASNQIWRSVISNRHKGSANVGFLDGHVEVLVRENAYFAQVPGTPTANSLYPSNRYWNGYGLDNDINGDGQVSPALGERILDDNEAFVTISGATAPFPLNGNASTMYAPGTGTGYGLITGLASTYQGWGPGFDVLASWFATPAAGNMGPTLPRVGPFKIEAGAVQ